MLVQPITPTAVSHSLWSADYLRLSVQTIVPAAQIPLWWSVEFPIGDRPARHSADQLQELFLSASELPRTFRGMMLREHALLAGFRWLNSSTGTGLDAREVRIAALALVEQIAAAAESAEIYRLGLILASETAERDGQAAERALIAGGYLCAQAEEEHLSVWTQYERADLELSAPPGGSVEVIWPLWAIRTRLLAHRTDTHRRATIAERCLEVLDDAPTLDLGALAGVPHASSRLERMHPLESFLALYRAFCTMLARRRRFTASEIGVIVDLVSRIDPVTAGAELTRLVLAIAFETVEDNAHERLILFVAQATMTTGGAVVEVQDEVLTANSFTSCQLDVWEHFIRSMRRSPPDLERLVAGATLRWELVDRHRGWCGSTNQLIEQRTPSSSFDVAVNVAMGQTTSFYWRSATPGLLRHTSRVYLATAEQAPLSPIANHSTGSSHFAPAKDQGAVGAVVFMHNDGLRLSWTTGDFHALLPIESRRILLDGAHESPESVLATKVSSVWRRGERSRVERESEVVDIVAELQERLAQPFADLQDAGFPAARIRLLPIGDANLLPLTVATVRSGADVHEVTTAVGPGGIRHARATVTRGWRLVLVGEDIEEQEWRREVAALTSDEDRTTTIHLPESSRHDWDQVLDEIVGQLADRTSSPVPAHIHLVAHGSRRSSPPGFMSHKPREGERFTSGSPSIVLTRLIEAIGRRWGASPALVTTTACHGIRFEVGSVEVRGSVPAMLGLGVRDILATEWDGASELMVQLFEQIASGLLADRSPAASLCEAPLVRDRDVLAPEVLLTRCWSMAGLSVIEEWKGE
jgi:hypothetical protein